MPQITLVPWQTVYPDEFGSLWTPAGVAAEALRALADGNSAASSLTLGDNDSNSLWGRQWRQAGGAAWSWANKTITNVLVQANVINGSTDAFISLAFVAAFDDLSWAEQIFNGEFAIANATPTWITLLNAFHANVVAALLGDKFLLAAIHYNHSGGVRVCSMDGYRVIVDYQDNVVGALSPSEI